MEEHRDRKRIARQALLPADTELKETEMPCPCRSIINQALIAALDDPAPQADQPEIGNRQRQQQPRHPLPIRDATPREVKAPALPVPERRFNPHPPAPTLIGLPGRG